MKDEAFWEAVSAVWDQAGADRLIIANAHRDCSFRAALAECLVWDWLSVPSPEFVAVRALEKSPADYALIHRPGKAEADIAEGHDPAELWYWATSGSHTIRGLTCDSKELKHYMRHAWEHTADIYIIVLPELWPRAVAFVPDFIGADKRAFVSPDSLAPLVVSRENFTATLEGLMTYAESGRQDGFVNPTNNVRWTGWDVRLREVSKEDIAPMQSATDMISVQGIETFYRAVANSLLDGFEMKFNPVVPLLGDFFIEIDGVLVIIEHKAQRSLAGLLFGTGPEGSKRLAWRRLCAQVERILSGHYHFLILQQKGQGGLDIICISHADIFTIDQTVFVKKFYRCKTYADVAGLRDFMRREMRKAERHIERLETTEVLPMQPEEEAAGPGQIAPFHSQEVDAFARQWMDQARWLTHAIRRNFCDNGSSLCFHVAQASHHGVDEVFTNLVVAPWKWTKDEQDIFRTSGRQPVVSLGEEVMKAAHCTVFRLFEAEANPARRYMEGRGQYKVPVAFRRFTTQSPPNSPRHLVIGIPSLTQSERPAALNTISLTLLLDEYFHEAMGQVTRVFHKEHNGRVDPLLKHPDINVERHQLKFDTFCDVIRDIANEDTRYRVPYPQSTKLNPEFSTSAFHVPVTDFLQHMWDSKDWTHPAPKLSQAQKQDVVHWLQHNYTTSQIFDALRVKYGLRLSSYEVLTKLKKQVVEEFGLQEEEGDEDEEGEYEEDEYEEGEYVGGEDGLLP